MQWKDRRQSENIEDRRPYSEFVNTPYLGELEIQRETSSGDLVGIIPHTFNQTCQAAVEDQMRVYIVEQNTRLLNHVFGPSETRDADMREELKSLNDHRQQSLFKMIFDGNSCESQLARFYNLATRSGLDLAFEVRTEGPPPQDQGMEEPLEPENGMQAQLGQPAQNSLVPVMKATRRFGP